MLDNDLGVAQDRWEPHDLMRRHLELRRYDHFVRSLDFRRAAAHQLSGTKAADDGEFEDTRSGRTLNHGLFFQK